MGEREDEESEMRKGRSWRKRERKITYSGIF